MTQPKARAPFFVQFGNSVDKIAECYKRYLVSGLRETFGLIGVPIQLSMRSAGENPYAPKKRTQRWTWFSRQVTITFWHSPLSNYKCYACRLLRRWVVRVVVT